MSDKELKLIISHELTKIQNKLKINKNIKFSFKKETVDLILNKIKFKKLHARDIKNFIRQEIQVPVARFVISKKKTLEISIKNVDNNIKVC